MGFFLGKWLEFRIQPYLTLFLLIFRFLMLSLIACNITKNCINHEMAKFNRKKHKHFALTKKLFLERLAPGESARLKRPDNVVGKNGL